MRKLTAGLFHSIDGAVESPDQWQFDSFDDELGALLGRTLAATDTVILGRIGYEEWAGFWPVAEFDDGFKQFINAAPKHEGAELTRLDLVRAEATSKGNVVSVYRLKP